MHIKIITTNIFNNFISIFKTKKDISLILIGETGSGKTSFLNYLYNIQENKTIYNIEKITNDDIEKDINNESYSKTQKSSFYKFSIQNINFTILDTPGIGDTRGLKQDQENVKNIVNTINENVSYVNGIIFIMNGRAPRTTVTIKYVISEITSILPKNVIDNICVVYTNCDELTLNANPKSLPFEVKHKFTFDNPYCLYQKIMKQKQENILENPTEFYNELIEDKFIESTSMLVKFIQTISNFKYCYTNQFEKLFKLKTDIDCKMINCLSDIMEINDKKNKLINIENEIEVGKNFLKSYNNYEKIISTKRHKQIKTNNHNTLCGFYNCHENCHKGCYLKKTYEQGNNIFLGCTCMGSNEVCLICGHSYTYHFHSEHLWILTEEKLLQIDENIKNQYDKYELEIDKNNFLKNDIQLNISKIENLNNLKKIEINKLIDEYKNIALNDNYKRYLLCIKEFIEHYHSQAQTYEEKKQYLDILNIINKKIDIIN